MEGGREKAIYRRGGELAQGMVIVFGKMVGCKIKNQINNKVMFKSIKIFVNNIDSNIWFYFILLTCSIIFLKMTFSVHPDMSGDFWGNVRVEFVGFCFDVFLLGLIFSIFIQIQQKRQDVKRWREEIDDFRGWHEPEAMFRIVGNIKRLNRAGKTNIDLIKCYLNKADLFKVDLKNSTFWYASLERAQLQKAQIENGNFYNASLKEANLSNGNFTDAHFRDANLEDCTLLEGVFQGANFTGASLKKAKLYMTNFQRTTLIKTNFEGASFWGVLLDDAIVDRADWIESLRSEGIIEIDDTLKNYVVRAENNQFVVKRKEIIS